MLARIRGRRAVAPGISRHDHNWDGSDDATTVVSTKSGLGDVTSGVDYRDYWYLNGLPLEERVLHADGTEDSALQHEYVANKLADGDAGPWSLYLNGVVQARES